MTLLNILCLHKTYFRTCLENLWVSLVVLPTRVNCNHTTKLQISVLEMELVLTNLVFTNKNCIWGQFHKIYGFLWWC